MSLIYDPSANNKPGKVDALYLDNAGFKQKQNNIKDHESALILNTSAIDEMEGEICGTDSMNLLIRNWRNVAGSADTFRDFGLNSLNPMMSKIQKSLINVDELNAGNIGLTKDVNIKYIKKNGGDECIDNLIRWLERADSPYDEIGKYGGNQTDTGMGTDVGFTIWFEDDDTYNFVRKHDGYGEASQGEVHNLLKRMQNTGCSYMAIVNTIYDQNLFSDEEFESIFGFEKKKDGDLNFRDLFIDVFMDTEDMFYLDEPFGIDCYTLDRYKYYEKHREEYKAKYNEEGFFYDDDSNLTGISINVLNNCRNEAMQAWESGVTEVKASEPVFTGDYATINRFSHYCREHGIELELKTVPDYFAVDYVQSYLDEGYSCLISASQYDLQTPEGETQYVNGGHMMTVTGTTNDKKYKVSSWGRMYYFDPINNRDTMKAYRSNINLIKLKKAKSYGSLKEKLQSETINLPGMNPGLNRDTKCMDILKKYLGDTNFSYDIAYFVIDKFEKKGSYAVAAAETIIDIYQGMEKEFEEKFHLDINREDVIDLLALDIFMQTDDKVYFDVPNGEECCTQYIYNFFYNNPYIYKLMYMDNVFDANGKMNAGMSSVLWEECEKKASTCAEMARISGNNYFTLHQGAFNLGDEIHETFYNRISHYFKENSINASINMLEQQPTEEELEQMFARGSKVVFWTDQLTLSDENGVDKMVNGREKCTNELVITGLKYEDNDKGERVCKYEVLCCGKTYIFDPEAHRDHMGCFCEIKYNGAVG